MRVNGHRLAQNERALLKRLARDDDSRVAAHARAVLVWADGLPREEAARASGMRPEQVQHWLRAFSRRRLKIFPPTALERAGRGRHGALGVSVLLKQQQVAPAHPRYVAELAQQIFNATRAVHQLPPECAKLLATAALLHTVGMRDDAGDYARAGRALILAHDLRSFSARERDMLACLVGFQRKKVRPARDLTFAALDPESQQLTLKLAAILRVADGLDESATQTTRITEIRTNARVDVLADGPQAEGDAKRANKNADLWPQVFAPPLVVRVPHQPAPPRARAAAWLRDQPTPQEPLARTGRRIAGAQLEKLLAKEDGVRSGTDADAIHDMRVASRRLRSLFRLLGPYYPRKELPGLAAPLRELAHGLGAVRDLDVLLENARTYAGTLAPERQQALETLLADWYAQRVAAHRRALQFLDSRAYRQWVARMRGFVAQAEAKDAPRVLDELPALVWEHYSAVRRFEARVKGAPLDVLHALRIEGKRLRYALEFFSDVLDAGVPVLLERLVALQDHLGELHDADVARQMVVDFITQQTGRIETLADTAALQEATAYLSALQARIAERHAHVLERWQPVIAPEFRQGLAEAVAGL